MSAILTPGIDLLTRSTPAKAAPSPFTTFARGHFVRPAATAQPVAPAFAFGLCDLYVAAPVELDFDEPNAVCDGDMEIVPVA
jgi:hypothetical protein